MTQRPLEADELAALKAFAAEYGREWKQYLMAAWLSSAHRGRAMGGKDTGILRGIRNTFGPSWLVDFRFPDDSQKAVDADLACWNVEFTDTFGGEANYCWVKRDTIRLPRMATQKQIMRASKAAVGLTGVRGSVDTYGDNYTFRPYRQATVMFVNWCDPEDAYDRFKT